MNLAFSLCDWQANAPGLAELADWQQWAALSPAIDETLPLAKGRYLPMMTARRLSSGSRVAVECGLALINRQQVDAVVFTSRHGELERNLRILTSLATEQSLSPTDFAMSVHNAAVGSLTIAAAQPLVSTSLAAGVDSFQQGLVEVAALHSAGYQQVMLVDFGGVIPPFYQHPLPRRALHSPYAVGLLLRKGESHRCHAIAASRQSETVLPQSLLFYMRSYGVKCRLFWRVTGLTGNGNVSMCESPLPMRSVSATLNRLWRILMTGFCFLLFGLGGLLLSLVWFNLLIIFQRDAGRRRQVARRTISFCFRFFLGTTRVTGVLDYRIEGAELLRGDRRCLVVANHPSLIDYVMLASVMPDGDCLVKADLQRNFFMRGAVRAADYLINSQADTLLPDCQKRLDHGDAIIIFPEGTRTRYGEPLKLQRGVANIAVRCGCDLRIVRISCTQKMLDKQSRWYQAPPEKPLFIVKVSERIDSQQFLAGNEDAQPLAARHLTQFLQKILTPQ